jgi:hypothetical protein
MTGQISDTFLYNGDEYSLIGMNTANLFSPEQFGMEPEMMSTACYRGFYGTYELTAEALLLRTLTIREKKGHYPPIHGIEPVVERHRASYEGLGVLVPFTGNLRIGKDFISELYIHMGYQKPTAFGTVLDIRLEEGRVVDITDRSKEMELKRGDFKKHYESGNMVQTINEAFSLDMDLE